MQQRERRDVTTDYRAELEQRLGCRPALFEMAALGSGIEDRRPYEVAEGVAIIRVTGVLVTSAWYADETEYAEIQSEVRMAVEDPQVSAILLHVNSPGGETDNAFETAQLLAEAKKTKPLWAVADNMAYSAGYLLASVADRLYMSELTGGVGSIGVYSAHFDYSKMLEQQGVGVTLISAGKGKTDGTPYQPLSEAARKRIAAEVDRLYGLFVGSVATHRKLAEEAVRNMGAALFHGAEGAIAAGLADKGGTVEDAWLALAEFAYQKRQREAVSLAKHTAATSAELGRAVAEAKAAGFSEALQILDLCKQHGLEPQEASAYLGKAANGMRLEDIRQELLAGWQGSRSGGAAWLT